uniref:Glabrous enhancer-binding protein-like DBD domain-containing protein n=1 Tax=Noccaea caerulescens TaxID=107243 RepID=A0A1J3H6M3_NOCCA
MATRKRLSFSSDGDGDGDGDGDVSVSDIVKHYSMLAAAEEEEPKKEKKTKKRKRKSKLIWSEEDELTVLKGLIDHGAKNRDFDWEKFYSFAQGSVKANVSEKQMIRKIRKLKRNYLLHKKLIEQGNDPLFTRCSDSEAFGYASLLWTPNDVDDELQSKKGGEETMNADVNENGAEPEHAKECRTGGEESREEEEDDECCGVRDALETQVLKGLSDDQKKFHLEKMMKNIGNELRKELSDEWKELSAELVRLNIKKLRFTAKVAEAANDG